MVEYIILAVIMLTALFFFWTQKLPTDLTAVLVMLALIFPYPHSNGKWEGILNYKEGFSGFGSSAVIMVTAMFIFGGAIVKTGAAEVLGLKLFRATAGKEWLLQASILGITTFCSMFINDTTIVLIFMPLILSICKEKKLSPSRYLLFAAYGSVLGGQWTLIGTRSNIIISDFFRQRSGEGLGFFDFTPIAASVFIFAVLYLLTIGRKLLPKSKNTASVKHNNDYKEFLTEVFVTKDSSVIGKSINELDWSKRSNLTIIEVLRGKERVSIRTKLKQDDIIIIKGQVEAIGELLKSPDFQLKEEVKMEDEKLQSVNLVTVEALISPNSYYLGSSLDDVDFNTFYHFTLLGISRKGKTIKQRPSKIRLEYGDSLLLLGNTSDLDRLRSNPNLMLLNEESFPALGKNKAIITLTLLIGVIITAITGLLEPPISIPLAAVLVILFGCINLKDAYGAINWTSVVTLAGMIPFGVAMEKTGAAEDLAKLIVNLFAGYGPLAVLGGILLVAVSFTQLIENAAVAIILAPIAYQLAVVTNVDPYPFMVGLAVCVSTSFTTPVSHESTILVMGPGNYKFKDYLKLGIVLAILSWLMGIFITPLIWPFK